MEKQDGQSIIEAVVFGMIWVILIICMIAILSSCAYPAVGNAGAQLVHDSLKLEEEVDVIFEELKIIFIGFQTIDEEINALYTIEDINIRKTTGAELTKKLDNLGNRFAALDFGKMYKYTERIRTLGEELVRWAGGSTMAINDDSFHIVLHELMQDRILRDKQRILGAQIAAKVIGVAIGGAGGGLWGEAIASIIAVIGSGTAVYKHYKGKKESNALKTVVHSIDDLKGTDDKARKKIKEQIDINIMPNKKREFETIIAKYKK